MRRMVSLFGKHSAIFDGINEEIAAYAREKGIEYVWLPQDPYDVNKVLEALESADAAVIDVEPYGEEFFSALSERCKLLVRFGVGYDKVDLEAATRHGVCIARTTGTLGDSVAEMALTQILALRRRLRENRAVVKSGVWNKVIGNQTLGKTAGVYGYGAIGKTFAGLMKALGCRVLVYSEHLTAAQAVQDGVEFVSAEELFSESDVISIHAAYSPATHLAVGEALLSRMKPEAVLSCTARGNIVDEDVLFAMLKEGRIAGAGLDVFSQEPYPEGERWSELDNVVLTPHVGSQTREAIAATYRKTVDIVDNFFAGREISPADLLNPDYKKNDSDESGERKGAIIQ